MQWLIGRKVVDYENVITRIVEIEANCVVLVGCDSTGFVSDIMIRAHTRETLWVDKGPDPDLEAARVLIDKIKEGSVSLEGLRFPVSTRASSAPRLVEHGEVDEESIPLGSIRIGNRPDGSPQVFVMADGGWSALGDNDGPSGAVAHGYANGLVLPYEPDSGSFARGFVPPHDPET